MSPDGPAILRPPGAQSPPVGSSESMAEGVQSTAVVDVQEFRARQAQRPLRPYDVMLPDDEWSAERPRLAEEVLQVGWIWGDRPLVPMNPPIDWASAGSGERSWSFWLHCWQPLASLLAAHSNIADDRYLLYALQIALDWIREHPSREHGSTFSWYDMAVGVRAYRLAYLLDAAVRHDRVQDEQIVHLIESAGFHLDALADEEEFASHSNHGIYQAAGQYALALRFPELPGADAAARQATERLRGLIADQFTSEGVHREHSPQYHLLVLGTFKSVASLGLGEDPQIAHAISRAEEALAWFVQPNMRLAMFGDSGYRLRQVRAVAESDSAALRFVLSAGKDGAPPRERIKAFPESGYVVFRDRWPGGKEDFPDCSYLAQTCAFHSRTHKHADDLSFVWYEHGAELVSEAGRYGYLGKTEAGSALWEAGFWYADPHRVYVESTRAHNTVEIDGASYKRKGVKPYGSALTRWGESDGVYYAESVCVHPPNVQRARMLVYRPTVWLLVFDWLRDTQKVEHVYDQRFHFDPALEWVRGEEGVVMSIPDRPQRLHMVSLLDAKVLPVVSGQLEPERLGWVSREPKEMLATHTSGFEVRGVTGTFATLFWLGDEPPVSDEEYSRCNQSGRRARFRWRSEGLDHQVSFARDQPEVTVEHRVTPVP